MKYFIDQTRLQNESQFLGRGILKGTDEGLRLGNRANAKDLGAS